MHLPITILQEKWYPQDRYFTEFEARIDYLLLMEAPPMTRSALYLRWGWSRRDTDYFLERLKKEGFINQYDIKRQAPTIAPAVIKLFNEIFTRKIEVTESRIRLINARVKEGKTFKPPVGLEQFRAVFEFKKKDWSGNPDMEKYLQITTLCSRKFVDYLEAARADYLKEKKKVITKDQGEFLPNVLFKT